MPFFVYGRDDRSGEVVRRIVSDAHSEAEARSEAEASGIHVTVVVPCPPGQESASVLTATHPSTKTVDPVLARENATFQQELRDVTPNTYVTYTLVAANFLIFILMTLSGADIADPKIADLLHWGAEFGPKTLGGEPWRLFTSMFVHIGLMHVLSNMLVFAYVGPTVERMLGNVGFLILYLVAGLGGSLWALYVNPMQVHAGASGAIFGVYGALVAVILREKDTIPSHVASRLVRFVLIFVIYNLINSLQPGISMAAHVGGLALGFICGLVIAQPISRDAAAGRSLHDLWTAAIGVVLVIAGMAGAQARFPNLDHLDAALGHFAQAEVKIPAAIEKMDSQASDDKIANADLAHTIENDDLPEWRDARTQLEAVSPVPGSLQPNVAAILDYMKQRDENWQDLADAWRTGHDDAIRAAEQRMKELDSTGRGIRKLPLVHLPFG